MIAAILLAAISVTPLDKIDEPSVPFTGRWVTGASIGGVVLHANIGELPIAAGITAARYEVEPVNTVRGRQALAEVERFTRGRQMRIVPGPTAGKRKAHEPLRGQVYVLRDDGWVPIADWMAERGLIVTQAYRGVQ